MSQWLGFIFAAIACLCFGSNYVPVKKFPTGDGIFFQWVFCITIYFSGIIVHCMRNFPPFYALPMLGGAAWAIGNSFVVIIIKTIGLGLGMLTWGAFSLLSGWATTRFGLFGIESEPPQNSLMNYIGVTLCALSALVYFFIKSDLSGTDATFNAIQEVSPAENGQSELLLNTDSETQIPTAVVAEGTPLYYRIVGFALAITAGLLFGQSFTPTLYVMKNYKNASQYGLDYVFPTFTGTFIASNVIFVVYAAYKLNSLNLYPQSVLPAVASASLWSIADISWFVANDYIGAAITFPILGAGAALITSFWSAFVFKEIRGVSNLSKMLVAFCLTTTGVILTALSK